MKPRLYAVDYLIVHRTAGLLRGGWLREGINVVSYNVRFARFVKVTNSSSAGCKRGLLFRRPKQFGLLKIGVLSQQLTA